MHVQCLISSLWWQTEKKLRQFCCLSYWLWKKADVNQRNYVNYSPKGSRRNLYRSSTISEHIFFLKKPFWFQIWKLLAVASIQKCPEIVHLYTVCRQMQLILVTEKLGIPITLKESRPAAAASSTYCFRCYISNHSLQNFFIFGWGETRLMIVRWVC